MIETIKKKYPILDEDGRSSTYPTFASQVFFDDGTSIQDRAFDHVMRRIAFNVPSTGWIQSETGRYIQTVLIDGISSHSQCYRIDLDMSAVTEDTINDIKSAWSMVDNAETVDGGIILTCFTYMPTIDLALFLDIDEIIVGLPDASGVSF